MGTPEIVARAGVTRGALYHQFADKAALFAAVAEAVEADVTERIVREVADAAPADPVAALHEAVDAWLRACERPEVRQVLLLDAPAVLGWEGMRDLARRYGLGLTESLLRAGVEAGRLPDLPMRACAHILLGALQEAALLVAAHPEDRDAAGRVVHAIVDALAA